MSISLFDFARPDRDWTQTSSTQNPIAVWEYSFIECCIKLLKISLHILFFFCSLFKKCNLQLLPDYELRKRNVTAGLHWQDRPVLRASLPETRVD